MTDEEYQALVARIQSGSLLIGVDRSMARKLYTDVSLSRIEAETGEAPYFEKMVVLGAFVGAPVSLLASFVLAVLAFGWWAALAIPVSIVVYFVVAGASSMPKQGMTGVTVLLFLALLSVYLGWFPSEYIGWYAALFLFALWNARLVYVAATHFVRAFVIRNRRAYEFLAPHIHLREASCEG
ncbi:hypothetical protein [Caldimonas aquatica]|uniref:DUF1700 domain-containing protein n=1 Tax=Caldimonas aquatica TaxID=376175 RepID=A0ABY6MSI2_9BURK|nr:hypothetical protein [Schlegelella aquatica]UZD54952.1 hypothetical protein OMP39_15010 [Schlegelella aquatica]